jgi:hypothetical protein
MIWSDRVQGLPQSAREHLLRRVSRLETRYLAAEQRSAQLNYFIGMLIGFVPTAGLGVLAAWLLSLAGDSKYAFATFVAAFLFGETGAIVSATVRLSHGTLGLAPELGQGWVGILASLRPALGGVFGALSYLILASGLMAITVQSGNGSIFMTYCVIAFIAGFSERFAHDMLGAAASRLGTTSAPERTETTPGPEQLELSESAVGRE